MNERGGSPNTPSQLAPRPILPVLVMAILASFLAAAAFARSQSVAASECDAPRPEWLACEDFEDGGLGWTGWFAQSPWVECNGCPNGVNDPNRIRLVEDPGAAHLGVWSLHMPAAAAANYQGASLTYRSCAGQKRPGCQLQNHEALFFRAWVRLAEDHQYVHHFLELAGTRPNAYWESDGNAGCRPNGYRWAGTTLDFNRNRELFFYTYFPDMRCDRGGYCSGSNAQRICAGCAAKDMPCPPAQPECCWGNHFGPEPPAILPRGEWTCLELGMRLNTPGSDDGWMAFWQDDALRHEESAMAWRDVPELGMNKAWLMHYIASGDASQSNRVWFDDVVVSTKRIGCGTAPSPTPPPPSPTASPPGPSPTSPPGTLLLPRLAR